MHSRCTKRRPPWPPSAPAPSSWARCSAALPPRSMMERGACPLLVAGCIAEVALSALYLLNEPVGALIGVRLAHGFSYGVLTTIATVITSVVPLESAKGEASILRRCRSRSAAPSGLCGHFPGEQLRLSGGIRGERAGGWLFRRRAASASGVFHEGGRRGAAEAEVEAAADAVAGAVTDAPAEEGREDVLPPTATRPWQSRRMPPPLPACPPLI
ncbi:MAG: hypothetical protein ACLTDR_15870 [Adlercreutzia equolifaciens]